MSSPTTDAHTIPTTLKTDEVWADHVPHSTNYINPIVIELVRAAQAKTILDVGCGNGILCGALKSAGLQPSGVDGDARAIALAHQNFPHVPFEVALFGGSPFELPFMPEGGFDAVVSTEVVEHLFDPREMARYCFDALKPGGMIAVSTPYHGYLKNLALSIANGWDKHHGVCNLGGHIKFFSRKTLENLLRDAGFEICGFRGAGRLPYLWKSMIVTARRPTGA